MLRRSTWIFIVCILLSMCLCFVGQRLLYEELEDSKAHFIAENPYFVTLGRLQNVEDLKGDAVILGSSMTERLQSSDAVSVIGVPGSSFLGGMLFLKECGFKPGTVAVVEGNLITSGTNAGVIRDTEKWDFRLFQGSRHFSIRSKPSSLLLTFLYDRFLSRADAGRAAVCFDEDGFCPKREVRSGGPGASDVRLRAVVQGIQSLQDQGFRPCIVWYPTHLPENDDTRRNLHVCMEVAAMTGIPFLDYSDAPFKEKLRFTDTHHLKSTASETSMFRNTIARDARQAVK